MASRPVMQKAPAFAEALLPDQGFPLHTSSGQASRPVKQKAPAFAEALLPDQGSNLDSSDPESDVLPITPSGIEGAKVINF